MQKVTIKQGPKISDYQAYASLRDRVDFFLKESEGHLRALQGKRVWMINSTATGGGVAEMLPSQIRLLRELGLEVEWLVLESKNPRFFSLTKKLHNAIHGSGSEAFGQAERSVYENENRLNLASALQVIRDGDLVVIHDPQPMPLAAMLKAERELSFIWRCHIGLEEQNEASKAAWDFLAPYFSDYDAFVFSLEAYVPKELVGSAHIITPAIDPLSHKNRTLQMHKCIGILHQSGILNDRPPILYDFYQHRVRRVQPDGSYGPVDQPARLDLIYRPSITQISRWDRLKGFQELLSAFVYLKQNAASLIPGAVPRDIARINICRLVLAGPDPAFIADDPEGQEVLAELTAAYQQAPETVQKDIALLLLPLHNAKENALIVNALQRSSSIIVQNSLQEGFGLTATEAMWKKVPVLVSGAAGLRRQVQPGVNGRINTSATDIPTLARSLAEMLTQPKERDKWSFNGQIRVIDHFTLFSQLQAWLKLWAEV